jgi:hypothetical protein
MEGATRLDGQLDTTPLRDQLMHRSQMHRFVCVCVRVCVVCVCVCGVYVCVYVCIQVYIQE